MVWNLKMTVLFMWNYLIGILSIGFLKRASTILFRDTGSNLDPKATLDRGVDYFHYDVEIFKNDEMVLRDVAC